MRISLSALTALVGVVLALVGGLLTLAPDVPDWIVFVGGLTLVLAGGVGLARGVISSNGDGRPVAPARDDRDARPMD